MVKHPFIRQQLGDVGTKATDRSFFDANQRLVIAGKIKDHVAVQRFGETGVGDGGGDSPGGKRLGGDQHFRKPGAERQDRGARPLADDPALADFQRNATFGHFHPNAFAARETERNRAIVMRGGGGDHMDQFRLIRRSHHHHTGQVGKERHVKRARMGGAIGPNQPGAVNRKADRQALNGDVMHDLIIAALQEGGIKRAERLQPACCHTRAEGNRVLFGDAHIKAALGKAFGEQVEARSIGHCRRDRHDLVIARGLGQQGLREDLGIAGGVGGGFGLHPGQHVKLGGGVALV